MFRLWGKLWKDNHLLKDTVICDDSEDTRTHKIFRGLESICYEMDLGNPIWLESTVRHFKKHGKARFYQDNFIEQIDSVLKCVQDQKLYIAILFLILCISFAVNFHVFIS